MSALNRTRLSRSRAVWAALATGAIVSFLVVTGVLLPNLGLIGAADAGTFGALDVPVGQIVVAVGGSFLLGFVLLVLTFMSRRGPLAWILSVAAVIATLVGSVAPLVITAFASVNQAQDVIPFIQELIANAAGN